ncbi:MAG: hypothetical protein Q8R44_20395 [Novosphingobium sp.]|nr:hypothetical protein [Novosphingobium sp.]
MQTERVTFLTSREHKKALDAFAASRGESVGNVVREATAQYIAPSRTDAAMERELERLLPEAEAAIREIGDDISAMRAMIAETNAAIEAVLKKDRKKT